MITKNLFTTCLKAYKRYNEYESELNKLGINLFERDEIQDVMCAMIELLSYCTKDKHYGAFDSNNIEYYLWETNFGKDADKYFITEADGTEIKFHTEEDVWNYLVKENPDIVDEREDWDEDGDPRPTMEDVMNLFKSME